MKRALRGALFLLGRGEFTTEDTEWEEGQSDEEPKTHPQKTRMGHPKEWRAKRDFSLRGLRSK